MAMVFVMGVVLSSALLVMFHVANLPISFKFASLGLIAPVSLKARGIIEWFTKLQQNISKREPCV